MKWGRRRSDALGPKGPNPQNQTQKNQKNQTNDLEHAPQGAPAARRQAKGQRGKNGKTRKQGNPGNPWLIPQSKGRRHSSRKAPKESKKTKPRSPKRNALGVNNKEQRYKTKSAQKGKRDAQGGWKVEMARPNWKTSNSEALKKRQENQNLTSGNCRGMTYFLSQKQWVIHIFRISIGRFRMKRCPNSSI